MKTDGPLPSRLKKEPLIDAIFEIRVKNEAPLSSLLPGVLRNELVGGQAIVPERTPAASIPDQFRNSDPQLVYAALLTMQWDKYKILIGDRMVAIACLLPYPGWVEFRQAIQSVMTVLKKAGLVAEVERYSLKYVDLIPGETLADQVKALDWHVNIGGHVVAEEVATLRSEFRIDEYQTIISVQTGAVVNFHGKGTAGGLILDVDSIYNRASMRMEEFMASIADRIDAIHASNKRVFFKCLSAEALKALEPDYAN
jgi:uncharacterized protein (TIGR04255 family)